MSLQRGSDSAALPLPAILDSMADGVTVIDRTGIVRFANAAAAVLMDHADPSEIVGRASNEMASPFDILDEAGEPMDLALLPTRRAFAGEESPEALVRFRRKGTLIERWAIVRARLLRGEVPDQDMVVTAFQDIGSLKRTEMRLSFLSEASALLGQSTDYQSTLARIAQLAVPTLADWCVLHVIEVGSPQRVAVAHSDPAMLALVEDAERRWPADPSRPGAQAEVLKTGKSIHTPVVTDEMLRAGARDDEHYAVMKKLGLRSALIVPLTARGVIFGSLTLINSTSQRDLGDEDVALAEELGRRAGAAVDAARLLHESQESIRVRDEFTAMASHDMRTPLAAVRGYAQLIRRQLSNPNPDLEAVDRWLTDIEVGSDRLARLVAEFTDASLLRGGQPVPLQPVATDLVSLAAERVADHDGGAGESHQIELLAEAESLVGQWDGVRLGRVLDNLIGNAVKFSPDGGRIEVRVGRDDGEAVIAVSDEGIGIPASEMSLIFTPSYRARNAENVYGTGLGLSGSQRLVEQMGGVIEVSSSIGVGSCFTIRLPLH